MSENRSHLHLYDDILAFFMQQHVGKNLNPYWPNYE